ncbi:cyclic nucleotide-binding domain-containing protein [Stutzerimonas stutzeri]|uniref:cyclic nucleotide-binding domain-containing protein n=1 Tax=Stutzerimonas stutzeri TaxID=316 RepID=UPI0003703D15|nr:cyclic nucleotide-binding domain-containing protein [Stutzerimonas stutzeri]
METIKPVEAAKMHCRRCIRAAQCLPGVLSKSDIKKLESLVTSGPLLDKGDELFRAGQPAEALYVIRSGAVQSSTSNEHGGQQIVGFMLAGDFLGVSALYDGSYTTTVTAMQSTSACRIPFGVLEQFSGNSTLNRFLMRRLGHELQHSRLARLRMAAPRSKTRIAKFILHHMTVVASRGLSATRFRLPMARWQIANHLGLAIESLSRELAGFRAHGILEVRNREVVVRDAARLRRLADGLPYEGGAPIVKEGSGRRPNVLQAV